MQELVTWLALVLGAGLVFSGGFILGALWAAVHAYRVAESDPQKEPSNVP